MQENQSEATGKVGWREGAALFWFVVVSGAFFAPLLGVAFPMEVLRAIYGGVLLAATVALARSWTEQRSVQKGEKGHGK